MARFKVLKKFRDKETKEVYSVSKEGESIELTDKRADEVVANLGDSYLERIEEPKEEEPKEKKPTKKKDEKAKE